MNELIEEYGLTPRRPKEHAPRWMVTFGDLLTLLLCFFITCISLGPLGKSSREATTLQEEREKSSAPAKETAFVETGTSIATTKTGQKQQLRTPKVTLYEGDFDTVSGEADPNWVKSLKVLLEASAAEAKGSAIEACAPEKGAPWNERLSLTWDRATALRRQVVDSGIAHQNVRVRFSTAGCGRGPDGREIAARVALILN